MSLKHVLRLITYIWKISKSKKIENNRNVEEEKKNDVSDTMCDTAQLLQYIYINTLFLYWYYTNATNLLSKH